MKLERWGCGVTGFPDDHGLGGWEPSGGGRRGLKASAIGEGHCSTNWMGKGETILGSVSTKIESCKWHLFT